MEDSTNPITSSDSPTPTRVWPSTRSPIRWRTPALIWRSTGSSVRSGTSSSSRIDPMAIAAANLAPVERVVTLAAPWHFSAYPADRRSNVQTLWRHSQSAAQALGALPMEVLQAAFWSLE